MSLPSLLGLLLLIGIVVSNAILLVDFATRARDDYDDLDERCRGRGTDSPETHPDDRPGDHLRPPSPGLGRVGGGSELVSSSLALTVIGGLATSTFLTLLVVPGGYSLLEGGHARRKKKRR